MEFSKNETIISIFLVILPLFLSFFVEYYGEIFIKNDEVINNVAYSFVKNVIKNMNEKELIPRYKIIPSYPSIGIPPGYRDLIKAKKEINSLIKDKKVVIVIKSNKYSLKFPEKIEGCRVIFVSSFEKIINEKWKWINTHKNYGYNNLGSYGLQYIYFTKKPFILIEIKDISITNDKGIIKSFINTGIDEIPFLVTVFMEKSNKKWIVRETKIKGLPKL